MSTTSTARFPLAGVRVLEVGGIGPVQFAGMMLAEMGADVVRVERPGDVRVLPGDHTDDLLNRGKRSIALDLKAPTALALLLELAGRADVLIEGYRPGVAERLGFGPKVCHELNPALVFGRMTGWGQAGPRAMQAGHDINYIGLTGALHAIGDEGLPPQVPLNLVGDFGGGALYLVTGVLAALFDVRQHGCGQVIDAAIVDGAAHLLASIHSLANVGAWSDSRGTNLLDGGAPFYSVYLTADDAYMAVGAIERRFYVELVRVLDLEVDTDAQDDRATWAATRAAFAARFRERTREQWTAAFDGVDACVTPVLGLREAAGDGHMSWRRTMAGDGSRIWAAPAPRFGAAPARAVSAPSAVDADRASVLDDWLAGVGQANVRLAPGLREALATLHPDLPARVAAVARGDDQAVTLSPRDRSIVQIAVAAAPAELAGAAVDHHIDAARALGAGEAELTEALLLASVAGFHSLTTYLTRVVDDRDTVLDAPASALRQRYQGNDGYWDGFERNLPGFLDALLRASPDAYEHFLAFSAVPWRTGTLAPVVKELIYVAIDATPAHVYLPGLHIHIPNALKLGATVDDLALVLLLAADARRVPTAEQERSSGRRQR